MLSIPLFLCLFIFLRTKIISQYNLNAIRCSYWIFYFLKSYHNNLPPQFLVSWEIIDEIDRRLQPGIWGFFCHLLVMGGSSLLLWGAFILLLMMIGNRIHLNRIIGLVGLKTVELEWSQKKEKQPWCAYISCYRSQLLHQRCQNSPWERMSNIFTRKDITHQSSQCSPIKEKEKPDLLLFLWGKNTVLKAIFSPG